MVKKVSLEKTFLKKNYIKKQLLTNILILVAIFYSFSQTAWDAKTASVAFKIKNGPVTVDGTFAGLISKINFDAKNYAKGSIEASVKSNSVNTGIDLRDNHLKKVEYFNTAKYPKITLKSVSFSKKKDGSFIGIFNLTIKATTKEVSIPFTYKEENKKSTFKGSFSINRLEYKLGGDSWTMADNVNISISLHAQN